MAKIETQTTTVAASKARATILRWVSPSSVKSEAFIVVPPAVSLRIGYQAGRELEIRIKPLRGSTYPQDYHRFHGISSNRARCDLARMVVPRAALFLNAIAEYESIAAGTTARPQLARTCLLPGFPAP